MKIKYVRTIMLIFTFNIFVACNHAASEQNYGSFSSGKTYSYDELYYATQSVSSDKKIVVSIYSSDDDEYIYSFTPARAWDFWGICWENDSYNIWIQSADIGIYCYEFIDYTWLINEKLERPEYIKSKYD